MNSITAIARPEAEEKNSAEGDFDQKLSLVMEAVDKHHVRLLRYLRELTDFHTAEDLLQELWRKVLLHFTPEQVGSFTLLRRKAYQLFVDDYRRRQSAARVRDEFQLEGDPEGVFRGEGFYSAEEESRIQREFWEEFPVGLDEVQREVVWRHGRYGDTFEEISDSLGIPTSTACDWFRKGRKLIQELLDRE